jgi:hypothetical protein
VVTEAGKALVTDKKMQSIEVDLTSDDMEQQSKNMTSPSKPAPGTKAATTLDSLPTDVKWILDWAMKATPETRKYLIVSC